MKTLIKSMNTYNIIIRIINLLKELFLFISYVKGIRSLETRLEERNIFKYSWFSYIKAVNLKAETLSLANKPYEELDKDEKKELEKLELSFISREISKYNDIFIESNLIELIKTNANRIKDKDFYGYMVIIAFNWNHMTLYNSLRIIFQSIIWVIILTHIPYSTIYNYVMSFF
jgi:hypothetical protein